MSWSEPSDKEGDRMRGLLYAYTQGITIHSSSYSFLTPYYLDYCARRIPEKTVDIKTQLKINWEEQVGRHESSMVPLSLIPKVLEISRTLFPGLKPGVAKQELLDYIGSELRRLEGHTRALIERSARQTFIIQTEEESGFNGYEFRLLATPEAQPWLVTPYICVPTIYVYASKDVVNYQVVINRKVTARGNIPYQSLTGMTSGQVFNTRILHQQRMNILAHTVKDKHTPVMSDKAQAIARLHAALRLIQQDETDGMDSYFENFDQVLAFAFAYAKQYDALSFLITALHDIRRAHNFDKDTHTGFGWGEHDDSATTFGRGHSPLDYPSCESGTLGRFCTLFALCAQLEEDKPKPDADTLLEFNPTRFETALIEALHAGMRHLTLKFNFKDPQVITDLAWITRFLLIAPFNQGGFELDSYGETEEGARKAVSHLIEQHFDLSSVMQHLVNTYDTDTHTSRFSEASITQLKALLIDYLQKFIGLQSFDELGGRERNEIVSMLDNFRKTTLTQIFPFILTYYINRSLNPVDESSPVMHLEKVVADLVDYFGIASAECDAVVKQTTRSVLEALETYAVRGKRQALELFAPNIKNLVDAKIITLAMLKSECIALAKRFIDQKNLLAYTSLVESVTLIFSVSDAEKSDDIKLHTSLVPSPKDVKDFIMHFLDNNLPEQMIALHQIIQYYHDILENDEKPELIARMTSALRQLLTFYVSSNDLNKCLSIVDFAKQWKIDLSFYTKSLADQCQRTVRELRKDVDGTNRLTSILDIVKRESSDVLQKKRMFERFNSLVKLSDQGVPYATFALAELYHEGKILQKQGDDYVYVQNLAQAETYSLMAYLQAKRLNDQELQQAIELWRQRQGWTQLPQLKELKQQFDKLMVETATTTTEAVYQRALSTLLAIGRAVDYKALQFSHERSADLDALHPKPGQEEVSPRSLVQFKRLQAIYQQLKLGGCRILRSNGDAYTLDPAELSEYLQATLDAHQQSSKAKEADALQRIQPSSTTNMAYGEKQQLVIRALRACIPTTDEHVCYTEEVIARLRTLPRKPLSSSEAQRWIHDVYRVMSLTICSSSTETVPPHTPFDVDRVQTYLAKIAEMQALTVVMRRGHRPSSMTDTGGLTLLPELPMMPEVTYDELVNASSLVLDYINNNAQLLSDRPTYGRRSSNLISIHLDGTQHLNVNVRILGHARAGKSSFIWRFVEGNYSGIYYPTLEPRIRILQESGMSVRLKLFDEDDRFHHRRYGQYNTRYACHIICVDVTSDPAVLWDLLETEQRCRSDAIPVIIVVTQCDKLAEDPRQVRISKALLNDVCIQYNCMGVYGVSAKTGENVDLAMKAVAGMVLENDEFIERKTIIATPETPAGTPARASSSGLFRTTSTSGASSQASSSRGPTSSDSRASRFLGQTSSSSSGLASSSSSSSGPSSPYAWPDTPPRGFGY